MTSREEFSATIERLEQIVTQLALLTISLRRLERELRPERKPDFNYQTGMPPEKSGQP